MEWNDCSVEKEGLKSYYTGPTIWGDCDFGKIS